MKSKSILFAALAAVSLTAAAAPAAQKTIIADGDVWSYYSVEGDPAPKWKTGAGSEGWKSGPTIIGWGERDQATAFAERRGAAARFPVAYFRKAVRLGKADRKRALQLIVQCDDGCIAYVNGTEIGRVRLPEGPVKPYTADAPFYRPMEGITIPANLLKKDNMIAVAVYQTSAESGDMRFGASLVAD